MQPDCDGAPPSVEVPPHYDDEPPFDDWEPPYEDDPFHGPGPSSPKSRPRRKPATGPVGIGTKVRDALRRTLAAHHGRSKDPLQGLLAQIRSAKRVLAELSDSDAVTFEGVLELLAAECADLAEGATVDLSDLDRLDLYSDAVVAEIDVIRTLAESGGAARNPDGAWNALVEEVQSAHSLRGLEELRSAILARETAERKLDLFKHIEPPASTVSVVQEAGFRDVAQMLDDREAETGGRAELRFSSGFRTLDMALTNEGDMFGFVEVGKQIVFGGPTGTGKSSISYALFRSMLADLVANHGFKDAYGVLFHTEEAPWHKAASIGLAKGQRFHHLARNAIIDPIGTSRSRIVHVLYDLVIQAERRGQSSGLGPRPYLPYFVFLDYIQAVSERGEDPNTANITTAELILRGIQEWNPDEMAKFSGVDFRAYAGMPWPEGMESHRCAAVTFAQLKKPDDESLMFYKAGSRKHLLSDFAFEDMSPAPAWSDPGGGGWSWEVKENDMYLLKQNQIMGSSKILQNADYVVMLHRSRPRNNPRAAELGPDGRPHLMDTRARLLLDKTRAGSRLMFVPMTFDLAPPGQKGAQYYDALGEEAIRQGRFQPHPLYMDNGDPILPVRPSRSPLAGLRY